MPDARGEKRSARMSPATSDDPPACRRPLQNECVEHEPFDIWLGDNQRDRVRVILTFHAFTDVLVGFALVQQTMFRNRWCDIAVIDSSHDDDVHLHHYARSTSDRVGRKRSLMAITCEADVASGYARAHSVLTTRWEEYRRRWHDA